MCGGTLEISDGQSVAICDYCGTQQTLPRLNDERIADLYDRANHFRRNNDYDKALGIYELILNENKEDAEAYWSIVLCRYGIEYVEDPKSKKRIPTINRAQFTSILADDDYKSALKYADSFQRDIYEREAKAIDEIHKNILKIVQKEEPYDVFICYKDKDSTGAQTKDRVIATEIYNRLTREKFKVFFAYVTLDEKLGHEYEPYIFAALQSAKVMIVLGTQPDYFNAVWVKNEWSRYLALIKGGAKKTLISAYKNMDAYDLPDELSLQAQDMDKMGFLENLVFNVRREVDRNTEKKDNVDSSAIIIKGTNENANNFIKRAFMALEDRNWRDATIYFEKVLNLDPECALAYAGKLLSEPQVCNFDMLGGYPTVFEDRANYKRAIQFADDNLKDILVTSLAQVKYRIACNLMEQKKYEDALAIFEIVQYKDSLSKASECRRIISAIEQERKKKEQERIELSRIEQIKAKRRRKRLAFLICVVLMAVITLSSIGIFNYINHPARQFEYSSIDGGIQIDNYMGNESIVEIPSHIDGIPVVCIGEKAFENCTRITDIKIPNTIIIIGESAFENCTGLTDITIPSSVTTIAQSAFAGCSNLPIEKFPSAHFSYTNVQGGIRIDKYLCASSVVEIPSHIDDIPVISIGEDAFAFNKYIKTIYIPATIKYIGQEAFYGCSNLTNVTFSEGIEEIGHSAFKYCKSLTNITLPDSLISIKNAAFGDSGLLKISFSSNLKSLGGSCFSYSNLKTIDFRGTVEQWNALDKGYDWTYGFPISTVVCDDGEITIEK